MINTLILCNVVNNRNMLYGILVYEYINVHVIFLIAGPK